MPTTEDDIDYFADRVRFFVDQEIPTVTSWNVDPHVLQDSLRRVGDGFTSVESDVAALEAIVHGITLPDGSLAPTSEWVADPGTPTYISATAFSLVADQTANYRAGSRIRATLVPPTTTIATVQSVLYNAGTNQTVITLLTPVLTTALTKIETSIVKQSSPAARTEDILDLAVTTPKIGDLQVTTGKIGNLQVTGGKLALLAVDTAQLNNGAVTNAKVGFKSLQGSTVIADGTLNGNPTINPGTITSDRIASRTITNDRLAWYTLRDTEIADGVIYGGVTRNHIVDGSIVGGKLQNFTIPWYKIANGNIRGSYDGGQHEIQQGTIYGEYDIIGKSIWGDNRIANGSISQALLAINAEIYYVNVFRSGDTGLIEQGQTVWIQNNSFPTRGGLVMACFFINGWMHAPASQWSFTVYWYLDNGQNQGYNVSAVDHAAVSLTTRCPMAMCGAITWQPPAGNHLIGIVGVASSSGHPEAGADVQNADILVCVFS